MAKKVKEDKSGNYIGDGTFNVEYDVLEFPEFTQIKNNVSKSDTTESVYVKYTNTENLNSVTVRFSNHENNAVKFGDQLNGFLATKNEILHRLGLVKRTFMPNSPNSKIGNYKYVPLDTITLEEIKMLEERNIEINRKKFLDLFQEKLLSNGFTFNENLRTYQNLDKFSNENRKFLLQEKLENNAFSYMWIEKNKFGAKFPRGKYIDYLMENKEQLFSFLSMQIKTSKQQILANFKAKLHEILGTCKNTGYPNICQLRDTAGGEEQIFKGVLDICNKTGMNIASAVAQYESSLS